jgi:hypothetical protein
MCRDCPGDAKKQANYQNEQGVNNSLCAKHARTAWSHTVLNVCRDYPESTKHSENTKRQANYQDEQGINDRLAKPCSVASRIACEAWHRLERVLHIRLQHVHFVPGRDVSGTEFHIPGTRYRVDAYHPETQTIYEYLGNHVHGYPPNHPKFTAKSQFLKQRTNSDLYRETMERLAIIASEEFLVYYVWHHEYMTIEKKPFSYMTDCLRRINP